MCNFLIARILMWKYLLRFMRLVYSELMIVAFGVALAFDLDFQDFPDNAVCACLASWLDGYFRPRFD